MAKQAIRADDRIEQMVYLCAQHGMQRDQVDRFVRSGYVVLEQMMDFHASAREADLAGGPDEIAIAGSRGPGKSFTIMAQVGLDDCQRVPELKWLFLRKLMKSAAESLDDLVRKAFKYIPHTVTHDGVEFKNGGRVVIGGYKDERDIDKYLGIEYDGIVIEEAAQLSDGKKDKVRGSMRTSKPNWRPRMYLSTNADGVGLGWFKREFILPMRAGTEDVTRCFLASYRDNPFLDAGYVAWLERIKGPLGKAWRDADFDAFAGMAFPTWNHERHVIALADVFEIPESWFKWTATDWGFASPFSTHWYAKDPDTRRVYVYREVYGAGITDRQQARLIADNTPKREKIDLHYADPSLWERKNRNNEVYTTADEYQAEGIILTKGDNDRIGGKRKVNNILGDLDDGEPGLQIFENCPHLIEQLSTLAGDPKNPEDVDTDQEDHAYDDLKYALTNERRLEQPGPPKNAGNPMRRKKGIF